MNPPLSLAGAMPWGGCSAQAGANIIKKNSGKKIVSVTGGMGNKTGGLYNTKEYEYVAAFVLTELIYYSQYSLIVYDL